MNSTIPLEDSYLDVINKACRGLGLDSTALSEKTGLSLDVVQSLRQGEGSREAFSRLGNALGLDAAAFHELRAESWHPAVEIPASIIPFRDESDAHIPNAYLVRGKNGECVLFDTCVDARPIVETIQRERLHLAAICITHIHHDHIGGLPRLLHSFPGTPVYSGRIEPAPQSTHKLEHGDTINLGGISLSVRLTSGHRAEGLVFLIEQSPALAVIGDQLYAGSMGAAFHDYKVLLQTNEEQIFSLPDETVLLPGHGPLTTVGLERVHNCFFAGRLKV